jgi:hypothetical protein
MYVVRDDFPIEYDGILGNDFLTEHKVDISNATKTLKIGRAVFDLRPYRKLKLPPRSKTIVQAETDHDRVGSVKNGVPAPRGFIGHCRVRQIESQCPANISNVTDKTVRNFTPHVTIEDPPADDAAGTLKLHVTKERETAKERRKKLRERIRATNQVAIDNIKEEKEKAKLQFDRKSNKTTFKIGDKILLRDKTVRRGRTKHRESQWIGPYVIIKKHSDVNFTIKIKRKTIRVHANRLKAFNEE